MGKASRTKRERRDGEGDGDEIRRLAQQASGSSTKRQLPLFWIVIGVLVVAGLVALVVTQPDEKTSKAEEAAAQAPTYADITVTGDALPQFRTNESKDPAVGEPIPSISGTRTDQIKGTIQASDGAQVIAVMAHWCPHCQEEVPKIVEWAETQGNLPENVEIRGVSTAASESQPNFPPGAWLAREQWEYATLLDDEADSAAEALGTQGYPFLVFVNADGTVAKRYSGEMSIDDFAAAVEEIAATNNG